MNTDTTAANNWVDTINAAAKAGQTITVDDREVWARFGNPVTVWGTGTVEVRVRPKSKRSAGFASIWVKEGQPFPTVTGA